MIRAFIALCGALAIAGCTQQGGTPTRSVSLGEGQVIATSPAGYCVDDISSQPANDFAILAPCASLGAAGGIPQVVGFATVQVGPAESGSIAADEIALRDFLITDEGVSLLSQTGDGAEVNVLSTQAFNSQVMIHFNDEGPPPLAGLQSEEWRAFTTINGRLVTIGVRGLAVAPLTDGPGATLLKLIVAGVQAAAIPSEDNATPDV
ncbi:dihydroxy-acid dehydratase [Yoonia sp. F2084L]|uniref:dihydroxy-acid dehydratase n=1 Tax=Yoonia sp. F2084L TaxID=2926419 RepID=UPI001FF363DA|nr:dihydroxy-acid dehydratase [Yoonia sp. F2084L]MCK0095899.1 dihydroxy-acid dehydratase [Yoonia sp. F2084L]